ncbi:TonB-dependent receptor [bacterium]|nr:TonB-dependent receptor [bacterium]
MKKQKLLIASVGLFLSTFAFFASSLFAQSGKIAGYIKDKVSGEGLIGASVKVEGTPLGAQTDFQGYYFISNVPTGTYSLSAEYIGYKQSKIADVRVKTNQTTETNFNLSEAGETVDEVIITAAQEQGKVSIDRNKTTTSVEVNVDKAIVDNINELIALQPGVVGSGNNLHIRGGRRGQVLTLVDGADTGSPIFNINDGQVGTSAIEETQVITSGFEPEYGFYSSGIVRTVTKSGNVKKYNGSLGYRRDDLVVAKPGVDRGFEKYDATLSGPEPISNYLLPLIGFSGLKEKVSFFIQGDGTFTDYASNRKYNVDERLQYDAFSIFKNWNVPDARYNTTTNLKYQITPATYVKGTYKYSTIRNHETSFTQTKNLYDVINEAKLAGLSSEGNGIDDDGDSNTDEEKLNGIDDDGDGSVDEDILFPKHGNTLDDDGDGLIDEEIYNGEDDDGDGLIDEDLSLFGTTLSYDRNTGSGINRYATLNQGLDDDGDGLVDEEESNGVDDDGDGLVDEDVLLENYNGPNNIRRRKSILHTTGFELSHAFSLETFLNLSFNYTKNSRVRGVNPDKYGASIYGEASEPFYDYNGDEKRNSETYKDIDKNGIVSFQDLNGNGRFDSNEQGNGGDTFSDNNANGYYDFEPYTDQDGDGLWDANNPNNNSYRFAGEYNPYRGFYYQGEGTGALGYTQILRTETFDFKVSLKSQLNKNHEGKIGIELQKYQIFYNDILYQSLVSPLGTFNDVYSANPVTSALYVQDVMEFGNVVVRAGGRFELYGVDEKFTQKETYEVNGGYNPLSEEGGTLPDQYQFRVLPRMAISFPVTSKDKFNFSYGHFYQRPDYDNMFTRIGIPLAGGNPDVGNPALKPQHTVAYDFGIEHIVTDNIKVDVRGYYQDQRDVFSTETFLIDGRRVTKYVNADYGTSRGLEFTLTSSLQKLNVDVNYALSWVTAKNADTNESSDDATSGVQGKEFPVPWDRRHQVTLNLNYGFGEKEGPSWGGIRPIANTDYNLFISYLSGLPYTKENEQGQIDASNRYGERGPSTTDVDFSLNKRFTWLNLNYVFTVEVKNVLDRNGVRSDLDDIEAEIDNYTGKIGYSNSQVDNNYGSAEVGGSNPNSFEQGRTFRFGIGVNF